MTIDLMTALPEDIPQIKRDMQEAFQTGAEKEYGKLEEIILPERDIDESLNRKGSIAYKAVIDGKIAGGAIVVINEDTQMNSLDLLYVRTDVHSKGIGQQIWSTIEKLHPDTKVWETATPYFEKRNIHFYINRLGFHAVEFFNPHHKDSHTPEEMTDGDYFFRFEKKMKD